MRRRLTLLAIAALLAVSSGGIYSLFKGPKATAADTSQFNAGNIIDDNVFYNPGAMSAAQVQSFLNSKVPTCDTNGIQMYTSTQTVAQYWTPLGYPPPYTCLKSYKQDTPAQSAATNECSALSAYSNRTAAQIITDVSKACDINPQVLVVLLQKEEGLVTDTSPLTSQYQKATGYGCPDTGPNHSANCNSQYYGFFNQVYLAAKQYRAYRAYPDSYGYIAGANNFILYSPDCTTGKTVFIENQATAGLYDYTPYVPDAKALAAGYGTGGSCSSYGNRNFWLYFTDWFGSTSDKSVQITRSLYYSPGGTTLSTGDSVAVSFIVKNVSSTPKSLESIGVAVRDQDNNNYNYSFESLTLQPGESYTYYQRQTFPAGGTYHMWIANKLSEGVWSKDWPNSSKSNIIRERTIKVVGLPDLSVSRNLYYSPTSNPTNASTEDITAASFEVTNNETSAVTLPDMSVVATRSDGSQFYYPVKKAVVLNPGEEYEYYQYRTLPKAGDYSLQPVFMLPSGNWSADWPASTSTSIIRQRDVSITDTPNVTVSRSLYVSPNPILVGQEIGASFVITNHEDSPVTIKSLSVRARDSKNVAYDFPYVNDVTLAPGASYTYYTYRTFDKLDNYTFYPMAQVATSRWTMNWPAAEKGVVNRRSYSSRLPKISLVRSMYHSPSNHKPSVGQTNAVSFVVKNNENRSITLPPLVVAVRDEGNDNVNFPTVYNIELSPGQTYTYYQYRTFDEAGKHRMWIAAGLPWGGWSATWPYSASSSLVRDKVITVY